jgi:hypothetical protein
LSPDGHRSRGHLVVVEQVVLVTSTTTAASTRTRTRPPAASATFTAISSLPRMRTNVVRLVGYLLRGGCFMDLDAIRDIETLKRQFEIAANWLGGHLRLELPTWMHGVLPALDKIKSADRLTEDEIYARRKEFEEALFVRQEASDFIRIHDQFSGGADDDVIKEKFKHIKNTSASVLDEPADSKARNILTELSFGAMIRKAGFCTDHSYDSDILWFIPEFGRRHTVYSVEVKRPSSIKQIATRVNQGADRIGWAVNRNHPTFNKDCPHEVAGGVIVLCCDRYLVRIPDDFYAPKPEDEAKRQVADALATFENEHWDAIRAAYSTMCVYGVRLWWRPIVRMWHPKKPGRGIWTDFHQPKPHRYRNDVVKWAIFDEALRRVQIWPPPRPVRNAPGTDDAA